MASQLITLEYKERIAALANKSHQADIPSPAEMSGSGTSTFINRLGSDTPLDSIVTRIFKELGAGAPVRIQPYITSKLVPFEKYRDTHDESGLVIGLAQDSKLRLGFTAWRGEADSATVADRLYSAEDFGCFIVECALGVEHFIGCCEETAAGSDRLREPA